MSNPQPLSSSTPTQRKILEVLVRADFREILRVSRYDTDRLRVELGWQELAAETIQDELRAWLGRVWIIDVAVITVDACESSALKE